MVWIIARCGSTSMGQTTHAAVSRAISACPAKQRCCLVISVRPSVKVVRLFRFTAEDIARPVLQGMWAAR